MFTLLRANKKEKEFEVKAVSILHEIEKSQIGHRNIQISQYINPHDTEKSSDCVYIALTEYVNRRSRSDKRNNSRANAPGAMPCGSFRT